MIDRGDLRTPAVVGFEDLREIDLSPLVPLAVRRLGSKVEKPVYLIEDQTGKKYVVKVFSKDSLRSPTGRTAYERELACYRTLPSTVGEHARMPSLVGWGPRHLILEYLKSIATAHESIRTRDTHNFVAAIAAFHWDTPAARLPVHLELAHRAIYSSGWDAHRNALGVVRRSLGKAVSSRCIGVLLQCRSRQPPLGRIFHAHNDLIAPNVFRGADGRYQFIDFASRSAERRWVLDDVVRFGFLTRDMELTRSLVGAYEKLLRERGITLLDIPSQVRFALLRLSMSMLKWSTEFRRAGARLILDVLLDEKSFDSWLQSWDSPFSATN
jgi:hypothetical protein